MSRRPSAIPAMKLTTMLPAETHTQLTLHLWSDMEGRVPLGAWSSWIAARAREFFHESRLDLGPYVNALPGEFVIRGSATALKFVEEKMKNG